MELVKVNRKEFINFLEAIHLNKTVLKTILTIRNDKIVASGSTFSEALFYNVVHYPIDVVNEGQIAIEQLSEFIKFVKRSDEEFSISLDDNFNLYLQGSKLIKIKVTNPDVVSKSTYMENKRFSKKNKAFQVDDSVYIFENEGMDISSINFKDIEKDAKLISKGVEPSITFRDKLVILENFVTGTISKIPVDTNFKKKMTFDSGDINTVFKLKPNKLEVFNEKSGKNINLFIVDDRDCYVIRERSVPTTESDGLPF